MIVICSRALDVQLNFTQEELDSNLKLVSVSFPKTRNRISDLELPEGETFVYNLA